MIGIIFIAILYANDKGREDREVNPEPIEKMIGLKEVNHKVRQGLSSRKLFNNEAIIVNFMYVFQQFLNLSLRKRSKLLQELLRFSSLLFWSQKSWMKWRHVFLALISLEHLNLVEGLNSQLDSEHSQLPLLSNLLSNSTFLRWRLLNQGLDHKVYLWRLCPYTFIRGWDYHSKSSRNFSSSIVSFNLSTVSKTFSIGVLMSFFE